LCGFGGVLSARNSAASRRFADSLAENFSSELVMGKPGRAGLDARKIFNHAERFHWSGERLRTTRDEEIAKMTLIVSMVLSAFASELYLKCLHCIDSAEVPPGHNLRDLFASLPILRQQKIRTLWDQLMTHQATLLDQRDKALGGAVVSRDFDACIADASHAFEQIRYIYEDDQFRFNMVDFPRVVRQAILIVHPTWEVKRPKITRGLDI
jgi:hypothetical protein